MIEENVKTAAFVEVDPLQIDASVKLAVQTASWPLIIKPSISYASISITKNSVVDNHESCVKEIQNVLKTNSGGVFVESFLAGRLESFLMSLSHFKPHSRLIMY